MLQKLRRPASDWKLFLRAYAWVAATRLALSILPFRKVYNSATYLRKGRGDDLSLDPAAVNKIIWAISAAARRIPRATCLTQALATQIMLGRRGLRTSLQLGVKKGGSGKIDAHAWLERDGQVLIGLNDTFGQLTRLPPLDHEC